MSVISKLSLLVILGAFSSFGFSDIAESPEPTKSESHDSFDLCDSFEIFGTDDDPYIRWQKGERLTWKQFQGKGRKNTPEAARTTSSINFSYTYDGRGSVRFEAFAAFHLKESWVKDGKELADLLEHEQRHFDITEWFVRKLRKKVSTHRFTSRRLASDYDLMFEDAHAGLQQMQRKYDRETSHSLNKPEQALWEKRIDRELKALSKYAEPFVVARVH